MKFYLNIIRIGLIVLGLFLINPLQHYSYDFHKAGVFYTENDSTFSMSVIFAGDAMVHSAQYNSAYNDSLGFYNFNPVFQYVKSILAESDLKIINLETTLGGKPYSGYPNFSSPDTFAYALKEAGFNYFALANNHTADKGKDGIIRTLDVLKSYNISSTGTFKDSLDRAVRYPVIFEFNTIKTALLNYTYSTNGISVPEPVIVNRIDSSLIRNDIKEARRRGAEVVMVYFHWGNEYERQPSTYQKNIAEFTFKSGADIIIGSHPHVVQPIELYKYREDSIIHKRWVVWSLGNFVSNQRDKYSDGGIMVKFKIRKNIFNNKINISDMTYIPYWVYKQSNPTKYFILPVSMIDRDDCSLPVMSLYDFNAFKLFAEETKQHIKNDSLQLYEWKKN